jgi:gamma-glutamylcyclotransferase (GGCT)/AIG2-like uncharacterized protein YtfP
MDGSGSDGKAPLGSHATCPAASDAEKPVCGAPHPRRHDDPPEPRAGTLEPNELIFFYGTLRTGGGREGILAGCSHVGPASVRGHVYDLGEFPALVLGSDSEVRGELWVCPRETLLALDTYEGVAAGLFRRVRARVAGSDSWVYVAGPALEGRLSEERRLAGGRWRPPPRP